jgi:hypothetical protein
VGYLLSEPALFPPAGELAVATARVTYRFLSKPCEHHSFSRRKQGSAVWENSNGLSLNHVPYTPSWSGDTDWQPVTGANAQPLWTSLGHPITRHVVGRGMQRGFGAQIGGNNIGCHCHDLSGDTSTSGSTEREETFFAQARAQDCPERFCGKFLRT